MKNLSVIVNGISNNERFLNKLFTEIGNEITVNVSNDTVSFNNIDDNNSNLLTNGLAKAIISEFERKLLVKVINKTCDYFTKNDKIEIWKISMRQLLDDEYLKNDDYLYRVETVKNKINEYLNSSDTLSLEGFVNFRLNDYTEELEDVVEVSVQEYMLELEYKEFISMLRYFVSMQTPKHLMVDVFYGDEVIFYADGKDITDYCINEFHSEANFDDNNKDDFVLNSIITIAPKKVNFHIITQSPANELRDTLNGVFGDKISYCNGCKKCEKFYDIP